jgi:GntR family transcriptional regulator
MAALSVIDRSANRLLAALPLYLQIAESLLEQVESGQLQPGDRLPPERQLSDMLAVNRMTVRRALRILQGRGLLVRRQGRGTFIAQPKIERQAAQLTSFTVGMRQRGLQPGARVIRLERRPAEASVSALLKLPVSAAIYSILRLRSLNQEPVLLERYSIPVDRFPDLERFDLEGRSLYEVFRTEYGVAIARARQSLEPVVATEFEADLLGVPPGAPLMLEWRVSSDAEGSPVEHGKDSYRGDRFRFVTETAPPEAYAGAEPWSLNGRLVPANSDPAAAHRRSRTAPGQPANRPRTPGRHRPAKVSAARPARKRRGGAA